MAQCISKLGSAANPLWCDMRGLLRSDCAPTHTFVRPEPNVVAQQFPIKGSRAPSVHLVENIESVARGLDTRDFE